MWVRTRGGVALLRFCASVSVALPRWCEGSLTLPRLTRVASAVAWHCRGRRAKHGSVVPPRITQQQSLSAAVYACCRASLPWYNCGRAALPYLARRPRRGASAVITALDVAVEPVCRSARLRWSASAAVERECGSVSLPHLEPAVDALCRNSFYGSASLPQLHCAVDRLCRTCTVHCGRRALPRKSAAERHCRENRDRGRLGARTPHAGPGARVKLRGRRPPCLKSAGHARAQEPVHPRPASRDPAQGTRSACCVA